MLSYFRSLSLGCALIMMSGCVSYGELVNFEGVPRPPGRAEAIENAEVLTIQPNDLLRIDVQSIDPEAAAPFNQSTGQGAMGQANIQNIQLMQGYLVGNDGYIDLPLLGRIRAEGQTVEELQLLVRGRLKEYLVDPVVNIRYLNFKVTVLGEVLRPGVVNLTNGRVTVLEAIGMAGDLTPYANRSSVLVVREQNGVRSYERLNFQTDDVFESDFYYLEQNDVIYVEPIRARVATVSDPGQRILTYVSPILSVAGILIAIFVRN